MGQRTHMWGFSSKPTLAVPLPDWEKPNHPLTIHSPAIEPIKPHHNPSGCEVYEVVSRRIATLWAPVPKLVHNIHNYHAPTCSHS